MSLEKITDEASLPETVAASLRYHREKTDPKENRESTPPVGESVLLRCCWVVESYLPSCVDGLITGLQNLGWLESVPGRGEHTHTDWIQDIRVGTFKAGTLHLGSIYPKDSPREGTVLPQSVAELPMGVTHVRGAVVHRLPSVTQLVLQFVFDDEAARTLEGPLHEAYTTWVAQPTSTMYSFITPIQQKKEAVHDAWSRLNERCWHWMCENLPGAFGQGLNGTSYPTVDFITLQKALPVDPDSRVEYGSFLDVLGLRYGPDAWLSDELLGLALFTGEHHGLREGQAVLSGRVSDITARTELEAYGQDPEQAVLGWLMHFDYAAAVLGLRHLLLSYDSEFASLRDTAAAQDLSRVTDAPEALWELQRRVVELEADARLLCAELERFSLQKGRFHYGLPEFERSMHLSDADASMFEHVRLHLVDASPRVSEMAGRVHSFLADCTSLISAEVADKSARVNIGLQKRILWLTVAIFFLTFAMVGLEVYSRLRDSKHQEATAGVQSTQEHPIEDEQSNWRIWTPSASAE